MISSQSVCLFKLSPSLCPLDRWQLMRLTPVSCTRRRAATAPAQICAVLKHHAYAAFILEVEVAWDKL